MYKIVTLFWYARAVEEVVNAIVGSKCPTSLWSYVIRQ
jgi:hypothetical protein